VWKASRVRRFTRTIAFELIDLESLSLEERAAIEAALEEQKKSQNPKWRVGAAAVAEDGTMVAMHNDQPGPSAHAEQRVLGKLYAALPAGKKRLRLIAIAGARIGEEVVRSDEPYGEDVSLDQIEWMRPCGKCLEFLHDCTDNIEDADFLSVTITGQVIKTTVHSLLTNPHTSFRVPVECVGGYVFPVPSTEHNKADDCTCVDHGHGFGK